MTYSENILRGLCSFHKSVLVPGTKKKAFKDERLETFIAKYAIFHMFPSTWETIVGMTFSPSDGLKKQVNALRSVDKNISRPSAVQLHEILEMIKPNFTMDVSGNVKLGDRQMTNMPLGHLRDLQETLCRIGMDGQKTLPMFMILLADENVTKDIIFDSIVAEKIGIDYKKVQSDLVPLMNYFKKDDYVDKTSQMATAIKYSNVDYSKLIDVQHLPTEMVSGANTFKHEVHGLSDIDYHDLIQGSLSDLNVNTRDVVESITLQVKENADNIKDVNESQLVEQEGETMLVTIKLLSDISLVDRLDQLKPKKLFKLEADVKQAAQVIKNNRQTEGEKSQLLAVRIENLVREKEKLIERANRLSLYDSNQQQALRTNDTFGLEYMDPFDLEHLEQKVRNDIEVLKRHQLQ